MRLHLRDQLLALLLFCALLAAGGCKSKPRVVPDASGIITSQQKIACNAAMGEIRRAAEAMYAAEGIAVSGPVGEDCRLIREGYLAGKPNNPHQNGDYSIEWSSGTAIVVCPSGCRYPPGH